MSKSYARVSKGKCAMSNETLPPTNPSLVHLSMMYTCDDKRSIMDIAAKLQIKPGSAVRVGNAPDGFALELPETARRVDDGEQADVSLVFVRNAAEVEVHAAPFVEAARRDAIAYIAYPKAGQLGTDLNRDVLWNMLIREGLRGVRQVSLDEVWSAMRFRPGRPQAGA